MAEKKLVSTPSTSANGGNGKVVKIPPMFNKTKPTPHTKFPA